MSSFEIAQLNYQNKLEEIKSKILSLPEPRLVIMIGLPLSGKDSLLKALDLQGFEMVSRDDILTNSDRENYSESYWKQDSKAIDKMFFSILDKLSQERKDVIVNATHLKIARRRKVMLRFPEHKKICIVMPLIDIAAYKLRNEERFKASAKKIPEKVFVEMLAMYEKIGDEEFFDLVINI
jgi:predicted kinase